MTGPRGQTALAALPYREEPRLLPLDGGSVYSVLTRPTAGAHGPVFVLCHPFGEEKLWAHRVLVTFARTLAAKGFATLRFDYRGNGDSSGEFRDCSLETILADVHCAVDAARTLTQATEVALVGLRFGGLVAAVAAEVRPDVTRLVLWAPVVDGARYLQDVLRTNLAAQMAAHRAVKQDRAALIAELAQGRPVDVDGYALSPAMYDQVSAVKLDAGRRRFGGPCLVVQLNPQPGAVPQADLQRIVAGFDRAELQLVQEDPFWKEIDRFYEGAPRLFGATLDWLERA
jgi:exosortase A-associated hydrolase 2